jgi:hypothetical protein
MFRCVALFHVYPTGPSSHISHVFVHVSSTLRLSRGDTSLATVLTACQTVASGNGMSDRCAAVTALLLLHHQAADNAEWEKRDREADAAARIVLDDVARPAHGTVSNRLLRHNDLLWCRHDNSSLSPFAFNKIYSDVCELNRACLCEAVATFAAPINKTRLREYCCSPRSSTNPSGE